VHKNDEVTRSISFVSPTSVNQMRLLNYRQNVNTLQQSHERQPVVHVTTDAFISMVSYGSC